MRAKTVNETTHNQLYQKSGYMVTFHFEHAKEFLLDLAEKTHVRIKMEKENGLLQNQILWTVYGYEENVKTFIKEYSKLM